jgi:antibiotic biosynthesis monooxygenase (ABM) superfamily enzyme
MLYNLKTVLPPPRWKMAIVIFVGAYTNSMLSRKTLTRKTKALAMNTDRATPKRNDSFL